MNVVHVRIWCTGLIECDTCGTLWLFTRTIDDVESVTLARCRRCRSTTTLYDSSVLAVAVSDPPPVPPSPRSPHAMYYDRRPLSNATVDQQPEPVICAMALCGEARGEQDAGGRLEAVAMAAVYHTALNRRKRPRWRHLSLRAIFLEKWQFSCFNPNDPNRAKLLTFWKDDPVTWERADTVCDLVESGFPDPTGGATHYCTTKYWNSEPAPGQATQWYHRSEIQAGRTHEVSRWGNHVFAVAP